MKITSKLSNNRNRKNQISLLALNANPAETYNKFV